MAKKVSAEDKQRAQGLFAIGRSYREIGKEIGVSAATISNWARDGAWLKGVLPEKLITEHTPQIYESANATPEEVAANTDKLQEANRRRWVDRKAEMADQFADTIMRLHGQLFTPVVVKDAKVVNKMIQISEVHLSEPSPSDKVKLVTSMAILVDKASLLVGDATSRVETASLTPAQSSDRLEHIASEFNKRLAAKQAEEAQRASEGQTG